MGREGRGKGGGSPGEQGAGRVREAGEERAGSGSPKRVGSRREMQNANYCQLLTLSMLTLSSGYNPLN